MDDFRIRDLCEVFMTTELLLPQTHLSGLEPLRGNGSAVNHLKTILFDLLVRFSYNTTSAMMTGIMRTRAKNSFLSERQKSKLEREFCGPLFE